MKHNLIFFYILLFSPSIIVAQINTISFSINDNSGQDTYSSSSNTSADYSNDTLSTFVDGSDVFPNYRRTFLQFDLTGMPPHAIIVSANLRLKRISGFDNTLTEINVITEDWVDYSTNHNNQPVVSNSVPPMVSQVPTVQTHNVFFGSYTSHSFDVTDQAQYLLDHPNLNYGWRLKSASETVSCSRVYDFQTGLFRIVCQQRGANYNNGDGLAFLVNDPPPKLEITYVFPIEITLDEIAHADTPSSSNGSISINAAEGDGTYTYQWIDGATGSDISGETSSSIDSLSPGWYGVEVTDGLDNVSYMAFVVGAKCGEVMIEFQPDGRFADATRINTGHNNNNEPNDDLNFASITQLRAERRVSGGYDYYDESLFKNRLVIPDNIALNSAIQHLDGIYHYHSYGNPTNLKNISEEWYEEIVTWNTRPSYGTTILTIPSTTSQHQDVTLDLTNLYKNFQDGSSINYGQSLVLVDDDPTSTVNRRMRFWSSNSTTPSQRPKLVLTLGKNCLYAKPERVLKGGAYKTVGKILYFKFDDEYLDADGSLNYAVYDKNRMDPFSGSQPNLDVDYGDNRCSLDASSLSSGYYTLELENDKKEKFLLRFEVD